MDQTKHVFLPVVSQFIKGLEEHKEGLELDLLVGAQGLLEYLGGQLVH